MTAQRLAWKVGLFVLVGLVLLAVLMIGFSKGLSLFGKTYVLYLRAQTVGGLKPSASVLMSGVQVGTVSDIRLTPSGTDVLITLRINNDFKVHRDAEFIIETSGFLGDEYVAIRPTKNEGGVFGPGDTAQGEAPQSFQELIRTAKGLMAGLNPTIEKLNQALLDVRQFLLTPETLTNIAVTAGNLRAFSERAVVAADMVKMLVATNSPTVFLSISNAAALTAELNRFADGLNGLLATNSPQIESAVNNLESSSKSLKSLLDGVQAGEGLAGTVLKDKELAARMAQVANNLSVTTSNLNRFGLWGILWKRKAPHATPGAEHETLTSPKER